MLEADRQHASWQKAFSAFLLTLIATGALFCGYLYFSTVRAIFARTSLPLVDNVTQTNTTIIEGRAPEEDLPDIEQKKERINILLLGIDQREQETGPWRTDTMILASIDPATNSASMLSIPRDLWVTIPGYGENRINMAHYLGDAKHYPGGGVALAKKTVWYALGVPVHYYVRLNFTGFEKLVDAIGGVTINVEKPIHDATYPDNNYGTIVVDIPAGVQHMDGKTTLQYARSRHGTSDYDRMARQRAVIMAVRDKALSLDIPISRVPKLLEIAGSSVQTDLTLDEILALAEIGKRIDTANVRGGAIDSSMTSTVVTPQNWMVEVADWEQVRKLVDELFPTVAPSAVPTPSLVKAQIASENARIELQNGTTIADLAQNTAQRLRDDGLNVVRYDNASRLDYAETAMFVYADKRHTAEALAERLNIKENNIRYEQNDNEDVDIRVILGQDYASLEQ